MARCGAWDGQQCRKTTKLTKCVISPQQGNFLKVPDRVVVPLCEKHFWLLLENKEKK
jgi:hypothetical protein